MARGGAEYDLLLRGGHVIDAEERISAVRDVAIAGGKVAAVAAKIDPAEAFKVVDVAGLYVTPGLIDIHVHVFAGTGEKNSYAGDNSLYPRRLHAARGRDHGGRRRLRGLAQLRGLQDARHRPLQDARACLLNIVGNGMRGGAYEQDLADMAATPAGEMAKKYPGLIVGIKTAHYAGPEWTPVENAVQAGTIANIPVMVDFGIDKPERPVAELVTKKLRPGDIYTHMYSGPAPRARGRTRESRARRGAQARRDLRRRARRRQLRLAGRGARDQGRLRARLHLHRPAHRQHERGHEGPAQRDEQVPRAWGCPSTT
jgi:dihydroorotase